MLPQPCRVNAPDGENRAERAAAVGLGFADLAEKALFSSRYSQFQLFLQLAATAIRCRFTEVGHTPKERNTPGSHDPRIVVAHLQQYRLIWNDEHGTRIAADHASV